MYEQVRGKLRYEEDGTGVMGIQARIRVQSYAGVQRLGQLIFSYQSANEKLEIRTVRVTKSNGKIVTAGAEAVQDMTSPVAQEAPTYSDQRQKHVVVPSLSPGDILEYETLATFEHPLTPGHFWQAWNFISDDICLDEQVELNVPLKTNLKTVVDFGPQSETKVESERRIYIWKSSNLQHAQPEPPEISNEFDVVRLLRGQRSALGRRLFLTSFDNWGEISSWYAGLEKDRRAPTTEVKAKADEVVRDAHSDLEKVRAIYEYVAKNIRYVSLSFGQGRYQPHFAAEVLAHEYGDCKDKATLLESMLDAEGIKAWPVLLQTNWDVQPDMPNPLEFDHVISYLRVDEKDIWLDSTLGVAPFEYLLPQVRGKHALLVKPGPAAGLVQIPEALQTPTLYRLAVDGSLDEARKVEAQMTFETRGDAEVLLRLGLTQVPLAKLTEIMAAAARQSDKTTDISFTDLEATDPFDTSKPLRFSMKISGTLPEETSGKETKAQPDNPFDASELGFILPFFVQVKDKSFQGYLGGPKEMQLNVKFSLPAKYADKLKPAKASPAKITKDFAEYEGKWSWDGKTLEGEWRLGLKAKEIQNDQIADYMDFRTQVLARLSEFSSKLTGKEGHFRAAEMVGRYSEAMSAQRKGKDGEAVKILQELVKEDPKYTDAWRSLGQVEEKRKNWAKSREAYEKVMELEPGSYSGYEGVIRAYSGQWRYDEAIAIAKKEVEKVTGQANGHMELGWLYLQTEKYALAVPEYEAVVKLLPKSPRMQIQLGQAYAGAHEREKAEAAFDKAVELDQSAPILNDAAYYSAEAGADLRKAENWSRKAVDEIEKKAGEVKLEETNLATAGLLGTLAAYWDTLGWIEFKKGNLATAEKYLRAACDLTDAGTIQMHMGRVYEAEQRKEEAIYAYSRTLLPTTDRFFALDAASGQTRELRRPLIPDEREATSHLAALLGGESKVAELLKEASYNRNWKRTVTTPNRDGRDYWVHLITMVGPGPKIEDMRKLQGTEDEKTLLERFHGDTPPQSFPDTNLRRIPRVANIHCLKEPAQCELAFLPIEHWQGEFSEIKEGESTGTMQK
ncbi:MAG TPA: DUF3857 domain-containing protein [Candidatus Angelobacter sp.]|nr:DUF3857 domain-containing protein [Candidatus Angelobacter sp.]